ncbi:MAG: HemK-related putative methylase [Halorubrum sp. J07HR59]|nr:MAG: HemK-related putative methylase [Halorubrum sp. J07HR59]
MTDLADKRGMETTVYEAAEDSRLLATAAVEGGVESPVLEVGVGSGWVSDHVATEAGARVIGSDLNPHACRQAAGHGIETFQGDLFGPVTANAFGTVLFNPPYLPTDPDNEWDDWMETALSGGESGRALIAPFLDDLCRVLRPDGCAYLLVSSLAGYDEVLALAEAAGLSHEPTREESFPFETLSVLRLCPARDQQAQDYPTESDSTQTQPDATQTRLDST